MKLLDKLLTVYRKKLITSEQKRELFNTITELASTPDQLDSIGVFLAQYSLENPESLPYSISFVTMVLDHFGIDTVQKDSSFWQQELIYFCTYLYLGGFCSVPETPLRLKLAVMRCAPVTLCDSELIEVLSVDQLILLSVPRERQSQHYHLPSVDFMHELGTWTNNLLDFAGQKEGDLISRINEAKSAIRQQPVDFLLFMQGRQQKGAQKNSAAGQSSCFTVKPLTPWLPITSLTIHALEISYFELRFGESYRKFCTDEKIFSSQNGKQLVVSASLESRDLMNLLLERELDAQILPAILRGFKQNNFEMTRQQLIGLMETWQKCAQDEELDASEYIILWIEAGGKYHDLCSKIVDLIFWSKHDHGVYLDELQSQPLLLSSFMAAPLKNPNLLEKALKIAQDFLPVQEKLLIVMEPLDGSVFQTEDSFKRMLAFLGEIRKVCIIQNLSDALAGFRTTQYFTVQSIEALTIVFEDYVKNSKSLRFIKQLDAINCAIIRVAFNAAREELIADFDACLGPLFLEEITRSGVSPYIFDALKSALVPQECSADAICFTCHRSATVQKIVELLPVEFQLQLVMKDGEPVCPFYFTQASVLEVTRTRENWPTHVYYALLYSDFKPTKDYLFSLDDDQVLALASVVDSDCVNELLLSRLEQFSFQQLETLRDLSRNYLCTRNHIAKVGYRFGPQSAQLEATESVTLVGLLRLKEDSQPFITLLGKATQVKAVYVLNQIVLHIISNGQIQKFSVDFDSTAVFCHFKLVLDLKKTGYVSLTTNGQLRLFVGLKKAKQQTVETLFYGNNCTVFHLLSVFNACLPVALSTQICSYKGDEMETEELQEISQGLSALDAVIPKSLQLYYDMSETKLEVQAELVEGNIISNVYELVKAVQLFNHCVEHDKVEENAATCKISVFNENMSSSFYNKVKQHALAMEGLGNADQSLLQLEQFERRVALKSVFDQSQFTFKNTQIVKCLSLNPSRLLIIIEKLIQTAAQDQIALLIFVFIHSVVSYEQDVQVQAKLVERLLSMVNDVQRSQALNYLIQQKFFAIAVNLIISQNLVISQSTIKALERSVLALNLDSFEQMIVQFKQLGILNYLLDTYEIPQEEHQGLLQTFFILCATRQHISSLLSRKHEAFLLMSFKLCYSQQSTANNNILYVPTAMPISHVFIHVKQFINRVKEATIIEAIRNLAQDNCAMLLPLIFMLIEREYTKDHEMVDRFIGGLVQKLNELKLTHKIELKPSNSQLKYLIACHNKQEGVELPTFSEIPIEMQTAIPYVEDMLSLDPAVFCGGADETLLQKSWVLQQGDFCFTFPKQTGAQNALSYGPNDLVLLMLINQLNNTANGETGARSGTELADLIVCCLSNILGAMKTQHEACIKTFILAVFGLVAERDSVAMIMEKMCKLIIQEDLASADYDSFSLTDRRLLTKLKLVKPEHADLYQPKNAGAFVAIFRALQILVVSGLQSNDAKYGLLKCAFLRVACRLGLCNKQMKMVFLAVFQQAFAHEPTSQFAVSLFAIANASEWLPKIMWPGKVVKISQQLQQFVSKNFQRQSAHEKQLSSPTIAIEMTVVPEQYDLEDTLGLEVIQLYVLVRLYEEKLLKCELSVQNEFSTMLIDLETMLQQAPDVKGFLSEDEGELLMSASDDNAELRPASQQRRWYNFFVQCAGAADAQAGLVFQQYCQAFLETITINTHDQRQEYIPMNQAYPDCLTQYKLARSRGSLQPVGLWKSPIDVDGAKRMLQRSFVSATNEAVRHEIKTLNQLLTFPDEVIANVFNVVLHEQTFGCIEGLILITNKQLIIVPHLYYYESYLVPEAGAVGLQINGDGEDELQNVIKQPLDHNSCHTVEKQYSLLGQSADFEAHSFDASFIKYFEWTDVLAVNRIQISGRANGLLITTTFQTQVCLVFSDPVSSWNDRLRYLYRQNLFAAAASTLEQSQVPRVTPVIMNSVAHRELAAALMIFYAHRGYDLGPVDFMEADPQLCGNVSRNRNPGSQLVDFLRQLVREDVAYQVRFLLLGWRQCLTQEYLCQSIGPISQKRLRFGVPVLEPTSSLSMSPADTESQALQLWKKGETTNLQMLLEVNRAGQRSELSLSNYPILPWTDERDLTYPPAAQTEDIRAGLREKYEASGLFNVAQVTSSAPIAIYFGLRMQPFEASMRQLQNKQYDAADRLFRGLDVTRMATLQGGTGDNRELTPDVLFLPVELNFNAFKFGELQDGRAVDDCEDSVMSIVRQQRLIRSLNRRVISEGLLAWLSQQFGERQRSNEYCTVYPPGNYYGPSLDPDAASSFGIVPPRCVTIFEQKTPQSLSESAKEEEAELVQKDSLFDQIPLRDTQDGPLPRVFCDVIQVCSQGKGQGTREHSHKIDVWGREVVTNGILRVLRHDSVMCVLEKSCTSLCFNGSRFVARVKLAFYPVAVTLHHFTLYAVDNNGLLRVVNCRSGDTLWDIEVSSLLNGEPSVGITVATDQSLIFVWSKTRIAALNHAAIVVAAGTLMHDGQAVQIVQEHERIFALQQTEQKLCVYELACEEGEPYAQSAGIQPTAAALQGHLNYDMYHPALRPYQAFKQATYAFAAKDTRLCRIKPVGYLVPTSDTSGELRLCDNIIFSIGKSE